MKSIIEERRKQLKITSEELFDYVGICRKSYYRYTVQGKPIPSDKLVKLAELLRCSTDYLLGIKKYTHITVTDDGAGL